METKPLTLTDMAGVPEAIISLVIKYPDFPFKADANTIAWQGMGTGEGIGLFTLSGAVYLKQYVSGSFTGQMPIRVEYQTTPTSSKARLDAQKLLENLAIWLEQCKATVEGSIEIQKIARTTPVIKSRVYEDGLEVYSCTMNIEYFKKN